MFQENPIRILRDMEWTQNCLFELWPKSDFDLHSTSLKCGFCLFPKLVKLHYFSVHKNSRKWNTRLVSPSAWLDWLTWSSSNSLWANPTGCLIATKINHESKFVFYLCFVTQDSQLAEADIWLFDHTDILELTFSNFTYISEWIV